MRAIIVATVASLLLSPLAGCTIRSANRSIDRNDYVKANGSLYEELPRLPGSHAIRKVSSAGSDESLGPVTGYTTVFTVGLPKGATPKTLGKFFDRNLRPEWRRLAWLGGGFLDFRRGDAFLSINLERWRSHILEISVDYARY